MLGDWWESHRMFKVKGSMKRGALVWYKRNMEVAMIETWIRCYYGALEEGKPRKEVIW